MDLKKFPSDGEPSIHALPEVSIDKEEKLAPSAVKLSLGAREGLTYQFTEDDGKESGLSFIQWTVLISVLFHALLIVVYLLLQHFYPHIFTPPEAAAPPPQILSTRIMSLEQLKQLQGRSRNVVQTSKAHEVKDAKDLAPYLGEQTQRVEKQTRANKFGNIDGGEKTAATEASESSAKKRVKNKTTALASSLGFSTKAIDAVIAKDDNSPEAKARKKARVGDGTTYGSHDYVDPSVAVSTQTLLNTDEYIYASFFNRLKAEIQPRWEPLINAVIYSKQNHVGGGVYSTQIQFTTNGEGEIVRVDVIRSSGAQQFDDAARTAFLQVLRIHNLPKALQDADGMFRSQMGFIVNLQSGGIQTQYVPDERYQ